MQAMTYLARLEPQGDAAWLVSFADVPEALTQGSGLDEAIGQAEDALAMALEGYLQTGRDFPPRSDPSAAAPAIIEEIPIRLELAARWLLKREMRRQGLSQVGLGRLMERDEKTVRHILAGKGVSLDLMLKALTAVGIHPGLAV